MAGRVSTERTLAEVRDLLETMNPLLVPLASEATLSSIDSAVSIIESAVTIIEGNTKPSDQYFPITTTISSDTSYTPPFSGRNLIFYASKAIVVKLNSASNDPIPLQANIGLRVCDMVVDSVHLSSVLSGTDIKLIITGR